MERGARIMERSSFSVCSHENIIRVVVLLLAITIGLSVYFPVNAQIWEDFTVRYDGNGAESGHISDVKYKSGTNEITLKKNEKSENGTDTPYMRNGCSFLGWSLEPSGGSVITPILPGGAEWEPLDVPITWPDGQNGFVYYARWDCGKESGSSDLLISPVIQPTSTPVPENSGQGVLLLAPEGRASAKNVDPAVEQKSSSPLPLKFTTPIEDLPSLPETGITSASGFPLSGKPAAVNYEPVSMELQIPTLGIISEIVRVDFMDDRYPVEWLGMNTGLLEGTGVPGEGFSVLAAHNTLDAETVGPFALISQMNVGDHIFIRRFDGKLLIFEIYANEKISEYDFETLYKQGYRFDNTVTLMTCEDERIAGGYASRRIVSAKLIG